MEEEGYATEHHRANDNEGHIERGRAHRQLVGREEGHQETEAHPHEAYAGDKPHARQTERYLEGSRQVGLAIAKPEPGIESQVVV